MPPGWPPLPLELRPDMELVPFVDMFRFVDPAFLKFRPGQAPTFEPFAPAEIAEIDLFLRRRGRTVNVEPNPALLTHGGRAMNRVVALAAAESLVYAACADGVVYFLDTENAEEGWNALPALRGAERSERVGERPELEVAR